MLEATYIVAMILNDLPAPPSSRDEAIREIAEGIATLASRRRCAAARQVHHSGISLGHLQILWILQEHGPLPVSRLADWLGIGVPNATGLLDRMEQRGLVARERDADDRRVVLASMTDAGRAAVAEHDGWRVGLIEQILAPLPTEHVVAVAAGIRRTCDSGDAPLVRLAPDPAAHDHSTDPASPGGVVPERGAPAR
jgi:DNA-binding MarR family transcriptional regulator